MKLITKPTQATNQSGYVLLLAMLIIGAACVATGLAILVTSTDNSRVALVNLQSVQANAAANACGEEGLQQINENTSFTGSGNLTLAAGSCTYQVISTGASTRVIDATGTVSGVIRKQKIYATIIASSISITSWKEVSDL